MKTVTMKSFFKTAPKNSPRAGQKRDDLYWQCPELEVSDLESLSPEHVVLILNKAVENHGRQLILANAEDWTYSPPAESLTVSALYAFYTAEVSRSRTVTKESLASAANWYSLVASLIGKSPESCAAGSAVINGKFAQIAGKADALSVMAQNLSDCLAYASESESEEILSQTLEVEPVISALLNMLDELIQTAKADLTSIL